MFKTHNLALKFRIKSAGYVSCVALSFVSMGLCPINGNEYCDENTSEYGTCITFPSPRCLCSDVISEDNGREEMKKTLCKLREDQLGKIENVAVNNKRGWCVVHEQFLRIWSSGEGEDPSQLTPPPRTHPDDNLKTLLRTPCRVTTTLSLPSRIFCARHLHLTRSWNFRSSRARLCSVRSVLVDGCTAFLSDAVLRFAVKWNMNSKHCHAAQFVVTTVLNTYTPEELNKLPSIKSTVEALLPYTGAPHYQPLVVMLF